MKAFIKYIFLPLFIGLSLVACNTTSTPASQPVTITFFKRGYVEGGTDITSVTNAKAVEAFEKANPGIKVNIVGVPWTPEGDALLKNALETGQDINVFSVRPGDLIELSKEEKVSNIEPYLTAEDKKDFYANGLQAATIDGTVYAWPVWVVAFSVFANTEIFEEQGVDLPTIERPWTWDEFVEAGKKLTYQRANGEQIYGFTASSAWWAVDYYPVFYIDGGRILSPDGKRFVQNRPEAISGLQKVADLRQVHKITPPDFGKVQQADAWAQFKDGKIAMLMSTPALIGDLEENNFPLTILPPPTGNLNKVVTTGLFGMYGVYNTDDLAKLEASHRFAKYITGSQVAKDVPGYQLAPSLRRSNTSYATTPNRQTIAQLVEFGIFEAPANISQELGDRYGELLKEIVLGKKTPQEAMDEIAPAYQQELDTAWN